ncbi:DUF2218 domain-containing protein [Sphaerisporangium sp. TRM90804]|uniref:DUF2218 domain-containing protein n=1 Tax=Sphaerisporangium sp. TRM90804 TaxID=3031113 RepID=UPI0024477D0C|nr:DUF2218 domain-containing protein [Sphaerisporangium sp. TRM90804]MDH2429112.1 DUF2218 domain-containing protein [Sphaerisporangium sp. TRM90804]
MPSSTARVATDAAARYAKQLASHLSHKMDVSDRPEGGFNLVMTSGEGVLIPEATQLVMHASAVDAELLARVQDVLGRHLERFGQRKELTVTWEDD